MQPESLVQLIGSGNTASVEDEWMRILESANMPLTQLAGYDVVLAELKRIGKAQQAETMASTALETLGSRCDAAEALQVAGPFLLSTGDSEPLRKVVTKLYQEAFSEVEGLEELLRESGIAGGRPVRRALRTLQVCLALNEGDYLIARDEDLAARVESISRDSWEFTITVKSNTDSLGAVQLADAYEPVARDDYRVQRHFAPEELKRRLAGDPASIVIDLCRRAGGRIESDEIEKALVPLVMSAADWKKWWTKARTALKSLPHVTLEGRAPYVVTLTDAQASHADTLVQEFEKLRDPAKQLELVERYIRDCRARKEEPSTDSLKTCHEALLARAQKLSEQRAAGAGFVWLAALRVGDLAEVSPDREPVTKWLADAADLKTLFQHLSSDAVVDLACECLIQARPNEWKELLLPLIPTLPFGTCDRISERLVDAGCGVAEFAPAIQQIVNNPLRHFDALLWLYTGPSREAAIHTVPLINIVTRILRTLEDARRSDNLPKNTLKDMTARARTVLPARRYERFNACLDKLEPGMGLALKTQIVRCEALGRAVREDLLKMISAKFPSFDVVREVEPWSRASVVYVTERGLARKQEEIEQHVNVKMKENARAIGAAAELGDLSENSEYKFALEERDLLRARLAQMNSEVAMAVVISPDDVPTTHIGIGTRAVFERESDGERYEMTFLGPWEAALSPNAYNYKAPLPQKLMGKKVGDVVEFEHTGAAGTYRVASLHNALRE